MSRSNLIRTAAWIAIAGVLGIALAVPGSVPVVAGGANPSSECGDLSLFFKIDDIADSGIKPGVYTGDSAHVETNWHGQAITISNVTAEGQAFDWASTKLVTKVAWKEATNIYSSTDGLPGYAGSVDDRIKQGISHVTFCGQAPKPTATPTHKPTATPTATVEEETATPTATSTVELTTEKTHRTPPPTETLPGGTSTPGWSFLLAIIAIVLALVLPIPTPRARRR
jgi:hypothetical protein